MGKRLVYLYFYIYFVAGIQSCKIVLTQISHDVTEKETLSLICLVSPKVSQVEWTVDGFTFTVDRANCSETCSFEIPGVDCVHDFRIFDAIETMSIFNIKNVPLHLNGKVVSCAAYSASCNSSSQNLTLIVNAKVKNTSIKPTSKITLETSKFLSKEPTSYQNKTRNSSSLKPHIEMSTVLSLKDTKFTENLIMYSTEDANYYRDDATVSTEQTNNLKQSTMTESTDTFVTQEQKSTTSTTAPTFKDLSMSPSNNTKSNAIRTKIDITTKISEETENIKAFIDLTSPTLRSQKITTSPSVDEFDTETTESISSDITTLKITESPTVDEVGTETTPTLVNLSRVDEVINYNQYNTASTTSHMPTADKDLAEITETSSSYNTNQKITDTSAVDSGVYTETAEFTITDSSTVEGVDTEPTEYSSVYITGHKITDSPTAERVFTETTDSISPYIITPTITDSPPTVEEVNTEPTEYSSVYITGRTITDSPTAERVFTETTDSNSPYIITPTITDSPPTVEEVNTEPTEYSSVFVSDQTITESPTAERVDTETKDSISPYITTPIITDTPTIEEVDTEPTEDSSVYVTGQIITDSPTAERIYTETTDSISPYITTPTITDSPTVEGVDTEPTEYSSVFVTGQTITDSPTTERVYTETIDSTSLYITTPTSTDSPTNVEVDTETTEHSSVYVTEQTMTDSQTAERVYTETTESTSRYTTTPTLTVSPTDVDVDTEPSEYSSVYITAPTTTDSTIAETTESSSLHKPTMTISTLIDGVDSETTNSFSKFFNETITESFQYNTSYHMAKTGRSNSEQIQDVSATFTAVFGTITNNYDSTKMENSTPQHEEDDETYAKKTTASVVKTASNTGSFKTFSNLIPSESGTSIVFDTHTTEEHGNVSTTPSTTFRRSTAKTGATGVYQKYHASKIASLPSTVSAQQLVCHRNIDSEGTVWNDTFAGNIVTFPCANFSAGLSGFIIRECTARGAWIIPKYDCVRSDVTNLTISLDGSPQDAVVDDVLDKLSTLTAPGQNGQTNNLYSGDIETITNMLEDIANIQNLNVTDNQAQSFLKTASNILDSSTGDSWKAIDQNDPKTKQSSGVSKLLDVVATYVNALSSSLPETQDKKTFTVTNILLQVRRVNHSLSIEFPESDYEQNRRNKKTALKLSPESLKGSTIFSAVLYENLVGIMPIKASYDRKAVLQSSVLTAKLNNWKTNKDFKIKIAFEHTKVKDSKAVCSFRNEKSALWEREGCHMTFQNTTTTVCECNHLTNFAILMSPWTKENVKTDVINYLSIVGCSVSSFCLVLTMVMHFIFWRYLKSERVKILMNLCAALVISYIIFLVGVDRTENKDGCAAVAALLHYIYLVVFFFMLAEGIEIFFALVYVFSMRSKTKWIIPAAWFIPAGIVGISLAASRIHGYGDKNKCWLSFEKGQIWAFVGPAFFIILINCVILVLSMRAIFSVQMVRNKSKTEKAVTGIRSLCVLLPLVGCTWIIGIFYVDKSMDWIQYLFAVCNGLQGVVIFIFHCVMNKQILKAFKTVVTRNRKEKECKSLQISTSNVSTRPRMRIKRKSRASPTPLSDLFLRSSDTITDSEVSQDGICYAELMDEVSNESSFESSNYQENSDSLSVSKFSTHL